MNTDGMQGLLISAGTTKFKAALGSHMHSATCLRVYVYTYVGTCSHCLSSRIHWVAIGQKEEDRRLS